MRGWSSRCSTRASRISSSWAFRASADASESTFTTQRSPVSWSSARCVVVARPRPRTDWSSYRPLSRRSPMRGRPLPSAAAVSHAGAAPLAPRLCRPATGMLYSRPVRELPAARGAWAALALLALGAGPAPRPRTARCSPSRRPRRARERSSSRRASTRSPPSRAT